MKFGGTSVGSPEALKQTTRVIQSNTSSTEQIVVVVSAMSGVTDALVRGASTAASGDSQNFRNIVSELKKRHHSTIDSLLSCNTDRERLLTTADGYLDEYAAFCHSIHVLGEVTPRVMDAVSGFGERISSRIVAATLRQQGADSKVVDASKLIVTDEKFQNAVPLMTPTCNRVQANLTQLLEHNVIPVVPGFVGATQQGVPTTLGRGGSDYSAAILASCLNADELWAWTDVDGVLTADPHAVSNVRVIPVLSYSEVGELAYFGAKVLHPRTIRPVIEHGIPVRVKNTFQPSIPGTCIVPEPKNTPSTVKAVTAIDNLSMITVEGRGMMGVPGIAARTFSAVASQNTSVLMISQASSEQSICFVIPTPAVSPVINALEHEMEREMARQDIDKIWSLDDMVIVSAVGAGMRGTPGISSRIFGALGKADINVVAIAQGSSECSISLVVSASEADRAVQEIHEEVIVNGK